VYRHVPRGQIADTLSHLRELFREIKPKNDQEHRAHERREVVTKNLLSNLFRTKEHPTLNAVLEIGDIFSLTLDGAHRLFGYILEEIREFDRKLNGGRTHIIESSPRLVMGAPHMFWPVREPIQPAPHPRIPAPKSAPKRAGIAS